MDADIEKKLRAIVNTAALTKHGCVDCRYKNNDLCDECAKEAIKAIAALVVGTIPEHDGYRNGIEWFRTEMLSLWTNKEKL